MKRYWRIGGASRLDEFDAYCARSPRGAGWAQCIGICGHKRADDQFDGIAVASWRQPGRKLTAKSATASPRHHCGASASRQAVHSVAVQIAAGTMAKAAMT
jgi:hypothetical protein